MKVIKFGGSSLASAEQLKKVLNIIKSDPERRIVVVSAPGKRSGSDTKVTDLLIQYAEAYLAGKDYTAIQQQIIDRYQSMADELGLHSAMNDVRDGLQELAKMDKNSPERVLDAFKASGENNNALIVAEFLAKSGLPAVYVNPREAGIIVSDVPGNAQILPDSYEKIYQLTERDGVLVIPGFFGYTENGDICTFSRGGSDISGAIVAAGVKAELYENFTDVDAIFSAHPGLVKNPKAITELTFREMRELSYAGFNVLHDEALIPAFHADIPVVIKNTNNPEAPGTRISSARTIGKETVSGIAGDSGFLSIYLSKYLMNREVGFGRKVLRILEDMHLKYEHMPSGIDDISIILREDQFTEEIEQTLIRRLKKELHLDEIKIKHDLAMVAIVGEGMKNSIGVAAKATRALADNQINIEMINQGSSEVSIMFSLENGQEKRAIRALYDAFFN